MTGGRPIQFKFVADVAQYLREVKKVEVSTEDIADALVGVTTSSSDLERKLGRAMRDAAKDTDTLTRAIKDLPQATDRATDEAAKDFDRIGDAGKDAGREVGDEFKQNLGESLASGDLEDLMSDTLGGLVAGLSGPIGLAGAALAGIAALAFNEVRKQAEEVKAFAEQWAASVNSLFEQGVAIGTRTDQLQAFNDFLKGNEETFLKLNEHARNLGINMDEYAAAAFDGGGALDQQIAKLERIRDASYEVSGTGRARAQHATEETRQAEALLAHLRGLKEQQDKTGTALGLQADASKRYAENLGLVDTNLDGIVNDLDVAAANAQRVSDNIRNIPDRSIKVDFYTTAAGKALLDRANPNDSPGHVAIYESKKREAS